MKFGLKRPCKLCPFRSDSGQLWFENRERAEEIEVQAYRRGFPCHETATVDDDDEESGFNATEKSQMCGGYIGMVLKEQCGHPRVFTITTAA